jgi:hypothetical protein
MKETWKTKNGKKNSNWKEKQEKNNIKTGEKIRPQEGAMEYTIVVAEMDLDSPAFLIRR